MRYLLLLTALLAGLSAAHAQTCQTTIKATAPSSRYQLNTNGTVLDKQTSLVWKRCAEGQTWQANGCSGVATHSNWQAALVSAETASFADYSDWRLPNQKELQSLVELRCTDPAINTTVFPNAPSDGFWSSSPVASYDYDAWVVNFNYGNDGYGSNNSSYLSVRLVRGGQ